MTKTPEAVTRDDGVRAPHAPVRHLLRSTSTRSRAALVGAIVGLAIVAAACSSTPSNSAANTSAGSGTTAGSGSGTTTTAGTSNATVKTAHNSQFGTILVNENGMALYSFGGDHGGQSACTGACAQAWPALTVPAGTTPTGSGVSGTLATSRQSNGTLQVTYNGALLYTFVSDTTPGQVTGNGVANFHIVMVSSSSGSGGGGGSASSTSSGGSGY